MRRTETETTAIGWNKINLIFQKDFAQIIGFYVSMDEFNIYDSEFRILNFAFTDLSTTFNLCRFSFHKKSYRSSVAVRLIPWTGAIDLPTTSCFILVFVLTFRQNERKFLRQSI